MEGTHEEALAWLNAPMPAKSLEQLLETGREALINSRLGDLANWVMDPSLTLEQHVNQCKFQFSLILTNFIEFGSH